MSLFNEVVSLVDAGLKGGNVGLPMGFDRLSKYLPNIQRGTYYCIGAETSVGKTAFCDSAFMYSPYDYVYAGAKEKLRIIYYSFEIDKVIKIAKGICRKIYVDNGVLLDVNYLLSRGGKKLSREHYELMMSKQDYFNGLESVLDIHDVPKDFLSISQYVESVAKLDENRNAYIIVIIDHAALLKKYQGETKWNIDHLSKELIYLRNRYKVIPVITQQFNREISSTGRHKIDRIEPQLSDLKETGATAEDANVVIALFSPQRYQLQGFRGYKTNILRDKFRFVSIMKNRDGESDLGVGMYFLGECGYFKELPAATEMTNEDYEKYRK